MSLEERIERGKRAIDVLRAQGRDATAWEKHMVQLETQAGRIVLWARELAAKGLMLDKPISIPVLGELKEVSAYAAFILRYLGDKGRESPDSSG